MLKKEINKLDYIIFFCFSVFLINIMSFFAFYEETESNINTSVESFINNKKLSLDVHYNYILRDTQKINEMIEKLNSMFYYNNLYHFSIYIIKPKNNEIKFFHKSNNKINDEYIKEIINKKYKLLKYNNRYFIPYFINLNDTFNNYIKKNKQGVICLEEVKINDLFSIKENELNFRYRIKIKFNIYTYGTEIKVFLNFKRFIKVHIYKFLLINFIIIVFDVIFIVSVKKLKENAQKELYNIFNEIIKEIKYANSYINNTNIYEILNNEIKLCNLNKIKDNKLKEVIEHINCLSYSVSENIIKIRNEELKRSLNEIEKSKNKIAGTFEDAFKRMIPDINTNIKILNNNIDISSFVKPANIATADGTFYRVVMNKLFICVYDVSGHSVHSSFKAISMQQNLNNILNKNKDINLKNILKNSFMYSDHLGIETVDGVMLCLDFETKKIEVVFLNSSFLVYFDKKSCTSNDLCFSNNISSLQVLNETEKKQIYKKIDNFKPTVIDFDDLSRIVILTDGYTQANDKLDNKVIDISKIKKILNLNNEITNSKKYIECFINSFNTITSKKVNDDRTILVLTIK